MKSFIINTDASFSMKWRRGAWAYWIKGDDVLLKSAGMFPAELPNPGLAELLAFSKALGEVNKIVPKQKRWETKLYINTDCKYVIHVIDGTMKQSRYMTLVKAIRHALVGYHISPQHVKAHTRSKSKRSKVNAWCDREARKIMKEEGYLDERQ